MHEVQTKGSTTGPLVSSRYKKYEMNTDVRNVPVGCVLLHDMCVRTTTLVVYQSRSLTEAK